MGGRESPARVSVVVPAHNAEAGVHRLLGALRRQTLDADQFEVIVVDDHSSDGTPDEVRRDPAAVLVRTPRRGGSYAARNRGLERVGGEIIAFVDADCEPADDWLEAGLAELESSGADLLGGRVEPELTRPPSLPELLDLANRVDQSRFVHELGFAATANLFARRAVFDRVGAFNERLLSGGDLELCRRATAAGFVLRYSDRATVRHTVRARPGQLARRAFRIGYGIGQLNRHGHESAHRERLWSNPTSLRPWLRGQALAAVTGQPVAGLRLAALGAAYYALCQVPMVAGDLAATVRRGRAHGY